MTEFKRRDLLAGAAALTAAAATLSPASLTPALAQAAASSTSGVFRHRLGDAEVIQILEGIRLIKYPDNFIANVFEGATRYALRAGLYAGWYFP